MVVALAADEALRQGLLLCGYDIPQQESVQRETSVVRFKAAYGPLPLHLILTINYKFAFINRRHSLQNPLLCRLADIPKPRYPREEGCQAPPGY